MPDKRLIVQLGMGTDITGGDYTKAAVRGLQDALRHNSLTIAHAMGKTVHDMKIEVLVGVPQPSKVDRDAVRAVLPYGVATVEAVEGGLEMMNEAGTNLTVMANVAVTVYLDLPEA